MGRKKVSIEEEAVVNKVLELYPCLANDKKAILAHIKGKIQEPSTEDSKIFVDHVFHYVNKNRGKLNFKKKSHYFRTVIVSKYFYKRSLKEYLTFMKTMIK